MWARAQESASDTDCSLPQSSRVTSPLVCRRGSASWWRPRALSTRASGLTDSATALGYFSNHPPPSSSSSSSPSRSSPSCRFPSSSRHWPVLFRSLPPLFSPVPLLLPILLLPPTLTQYCL
eukprot:3102188-Rhodomonas_salina.2